MKLKLDWNDPATWRGAVWVVAFVYGVLFPTQIQNVLLLAAGVAGGLGALTAKKD